MSNDIGNMTERISYRLANLADMPAIHAIQEESYPPSMQEKQEIILRRLQEAPATCWIAEDKEGACAYLFTYPSRLGAVTALEGGFLVADDADTLYLHDLAVLQRATGRGVGKALFNLAMKFARAQRMPYSALVSVQDSYPYWSKLGYIPGTPSPEYGDCLKSYPEDAIYMVKSLNYS